MPVLKPAGDSPQRGRLLDQQAELLRALVNRRQIPAEFDTSRVQAAARTLACKRCHEAAKAWPALVHWLGEDFPQRFAAYAQASPLPSAGGPLADGWAFVHRLARTEPLPDEVRQARFAIGLRYTWRPSGLRPRRGPVFKVLLLRQSLRLLFGLRWPVSLTDSTVWIRAVGVPWIQN